MSFDKVKARRNAERFLAQGKIKAAIGEYKQLVDNDPKDFTILNILGELYVKNSEQKEAINCFTRVAEHYNQQGFAQKAIAIYNKIARLQPDSIEISSKLAQLYQIKGSFAEARTHYLSLAAQYENKGQKIEALAIWKQIAELDPNNNEIYLKIAETYQQQEQLEEAVKAFNEGGLRLAKQNKHEEALAAFSRALEISPDDFAALNGMVKSQISLGYSDDAAKKLEEILEKQPGNKEIIYLLTDCYIDLNKPMDAERVIVRLVQLEPANYPKLLELIEIYLKVNDFDSVNRILLITAENLLANGQSEDLLKWLNEILARNPESLEALRLLARYYSWHRNESELKLTLERLAEAAHLEGNAEDERYALSQLVLIVPQEEEYARRLQEISPEHDFSPVEPLFENTVEENRTEDVPSFENFAILHGESEFQPQSVSVESFESFQTFENEYSGHAETGNGNGSYEYPVEATIVETNETLYEAQFAGAEDQYSNAGIEPAAELRIQEQVQGVRFYIEQGYRDFAEKELRDLEESFGDLPEVSELRKTFEETFQNSDSPKDFETEKTSEENVVLDDFAPNPPTQNGFNLDSFDDFKNALGLDETAASIQDDYETHYHMAIAYQEMGLMEDAVREYQNAINLVSPGDGTRRFFQCANLLGLCFMEKQMPTLALIWFSRANETADLSEEERHGLLFEMANAYEVGGEPEKAVEYFEKIYAYDVDYREVGKRLENLRMINFSS